MADMTNWRVEKRPHSYNDGTAHRWAVVADSADHEGNTMRIQLADRLSENTARLIATAPDLLSALERLMDHLDNGDGHNMGKAEAFARAVIAKAKGA